MRPEHDPDARPAALRLAELLATHLCHELSGPMSGLGLALEEAGADAEALALAQDAAAALRARLRLLRAAWGAPTPLDAAQLPALLAGLPATPPRRLALAGPLAEAALPAEAARLLLNAAMLAAESLPEGGEITLAGDGAREAVLTIAGPRAAWPAGFAAMLADPAPAWAHIMAAGPGGRIQAALTALLAHASGARARPLLGAAGAGPAPVLFAFSDSPR